MLLTTAPQTNVNLRHIVLRHCSVVKQRENDPDAVVLFQHLKF